MKILLAARDESDGILLTDYVAKNFSNKEHEFVIVHVIPPVTSYVGLAPVAELLDEAIRLDHQTAREIVRTVSSRLKTNGLVGEDDTDELVVEGNIADEILRAANLLNCDLIIVGRSQRKGLQKWLLSSPIARVATSSQCATLVA